MLIFGHTGITLATAILLNKTLPTKRESSKRPVFSKENPSQQIPLSNDSSWITSLGRRFDIRLILIGSLFPDIIDKPLGLFIFQDIFGTGRMYSHTLLFFIIITLIGLYVYIKHKKTWILALSFGIFMHLILDAMWMTPQTLFWPIFGFSFEKHEAIAFSDWIQELYSKILSYPIIASIEALGAAIIIWFFFRLLYKRRLFLFLKTGQV